MKKLKMLNDEIESKLEELNELEIGSDEYSTAVDDLETLYKLSLENEKMNNDKNCKDKQFINQNITDFIKIGVEVAGIILPLVFYNKWMEEGLKFEETGAFTSSTFKGLIQKFKPMK